MDGQDRFLRTLLYQNVDRPPLFDDGIRNDVLKKWYSQGLRRRDKLEDIFTIDFRQEIEPELEPMPPPSKWPTSLDGLKQFMSRFDSNDPKRLPENWEEKVHEWQKRDYPLILRVHRGYFLTMGVYGWRRFTDAVRLLVDDPDLVHAWMEFYAEFTCDLIEKILSVVQVDAALFSEPIGGNNGPLISPKMYSSFILKSYSPIIQLLNSRSVNLIIYRTYANTRALLPSVVEAGFNCLWACECNPQAMDYRVIRQEFGKDLRLIGGIDSDALRSTKAELNRTMIETLPKLLQEGGFIPLADGRVREDVPYENYVLYRKLLESLTTSS